jgi:hypothetical protein
MTDRNVAGIEVEDFTEALLVLRSVNGANGLDAVCDLLAMGEADGVFDRGYNISAAARPSFAPLAFMTRPRSLPRPRSVRLAARRRSPNGSPPGKTGDEAGRAQGQAEINRHPL